MVKTLRGQKIVKVVLVLSGVFLWATPFLPAQLVPAEQPLAQSEESFSSFALGFNYTGGQVRYNLNPHWSGELRYLTGSENASTGKVTSHVLGLRGYRFFRESSRYRFFLGAEAAMADSDQKNTSYKVSGPAAGGFGGLEWRFGRRFSLGFDIGPYLLSLKEEKTDVSDTSLEFIANTAFLFYLF